MRDVLLYIQLLLRQCISQLIQPSQHQWLICTVLAAVLKTIKLRSLRLSQQDIIMREQVHRLWRNVFADIDDIDDKALMQHKQKSALWGSVLVTIF